MSGKMRHRFQVNGCISDLGSCHWQDRGALRGPRSGNLSLVVASPPHECGEIL